MLNTYILFYFILRSIYFWFGYTKVIRCKNYNQLWQPILFGIVPGPLEIIFFSAIFQWLEKKLEILG